MKRVKSILSIVCFAFLAVFGFAGCGDETVDNRPKNSVTYAQALLNEYNFKQKYNITETTWEDDNKIVNDYKVRL